MVKAIRGIANPLGTLDQHSTVIESIANAGEGVDILNRHREKIGDGFVHLEGDNVILTGYVQEGVYEGSLEDAGLSVGFNAGNLKAREVDGVGYYKDVVITEVSLTPLPSNKGAKVTKTREEENKEKEEEKMTVNETQEIMKQAIEAGVKNRELQAKVDELEKEREALKKEREAGLGTSVEPDEKKFMRELGEKMATMPEKGFLREFTNAGDLNVVNSLGSITSKFAKKSAIYDSATKARFQGLTLAEDGDDGNFKADLFKAGGDKKKATTATKRSLRPQMAEAYLEMDKATVKGVNDAGALSEYVMSIIPNLVIQKIEYNMILGKNDGTNGIYGLKGETTDKWTTQLEYTDLFEGITDAVAECSISDAITIVMSAKTFAELRKLKGTDGHSRFNELATKAQIAQSFGAVNLETRVWMPDGEVAVYNHDEFVLIGDLNMDNYNDFDLRYNVEQWLAEVLVGGSIRGKNRSAYLTKKAD